MFCRWSLLPALAALAAAAISHSAQAHSWIDCIDTDRTVVYDNARAWIYGGETSNGRCKGYINNYPGRGDPSINSKMTYKVLMDDVLRGVAPCPSNSGGGNEKDFPHLKVHAGEKFYYGYLDNGHTSKDKAGRGTFYGVYWTGEPGTSLGSTTELTDKHLVDGALHDFDDGNCGQTYEDGDFSGSILSGRAGNDYPCVGNLAIPAGTKPGIYNLIWFWRFYNEKVNAAVVTTGGHYGGAAYSSCFQVEVLTGGEVGNEVNPSSELPAMELSATATLGSVSPATTTPETEAPTSEPPMVTSSPLSTESLVLATTTTAASPVAQTPPTTASPTTQPAATTSVPDTQQYKKKDCGAQGRRHLDSQQQQRLRG